MVRRFHFLLLFAVPGLVVSCVIAQRGRPTAVTTVTRWKCAAETSAIALHLRKWVVGYTAPQSVDADTYRMRIELPRVPTESVSIVNVAPLCERAGLAHAREYGQQLAPGLYQMAVVRAGGRYVVRNGTAPISAGEWNFISVFDTAFHLKRSILGF